MNLGSTHQPSTGTARIADLFGVAARHHQEGRLAEAEACYRRVLAAEPGNADALNMLGIVALQSGRSDAAVEMIRQAIAKNATNPAYFYNLGIALRAQGKLSEAVAAARQAVGLKPDMAEAHFSLASFLQEEGKLEEAIAAYRQTIRFRPELAQAHCNLGDALRRQGQPREAAAACREALRLDPNQPAAHCHLGCALHDQGQLEDAVAEFRHAIRLMPDFSEAHCYLGNVLCKQGKLEEAVAATRRAIQIRPDYAEAHSNVAAMFQQLGLLDEAVAAGRQAIRVAPGYADAHYNLGCALSNQHRHAEAIAAWRQAVRIKPGHREALANLGNGLRELGELEEAVIASREAIRVAPGHAAAHASLGAALSDQANLDEAFAAYREAIRLKPDFVEASSALLACMNYSERVSPAALFEAHRSWHERYGRPAQRPLAYANDRSEGRRLKVGYVSPDLRGHSVAQFLEPLLQNHDRGQIEIFCYADVSAPDGWTKRFEELADHWVVTIAMSDDALAERIRSDGIDILVDLAGHTSKNRLMVFARKPAPLQITWLGYPNSTGLEAIDYRLVDARDRPTRRGRRAGERNFGTSARVFSLLWRLRRRSGADTATLPRNRWRHFRIIQQPRQAVRGHARCLGEIADPATAGAFVVEGKVVWRCLDAGLVSRSPLATRGCGSDESNSSPSCRKATRILRSTTASILLWIHFPIMAPPRRARLCGWECR